MNWRKHNNLYTLYVMTITLAIQIFHNFILMFICHISKLVLVIVFENIPKIFGNDHKKIVWILNWLK